MQKNKIKRMEFLMTEGEMITLEEIAKMDGVSKGEALRFALRQLAKRKRYATAA